MKYLLLGMGKSNQSVEKYFIKQGIEYLKYDDKSCKVDINLDEVDIIVKTPGMRNHHFLLQNNKKVVTDLELFYLINNDKTFITVTGSNGKTTTVKLLKHLIKDVDLGGNVGYPLFDFVESRHDIIIEASSFMLEYIEKFHSKYNVLLNIYCTHLEHHHSFSNYVECKLNLLKNIREDDYIIYNYDDQLLRKLVSNYPGIKVPFSRTKDIGIYLDNDSIIYQGQVIEKISNINLIGEHNIDNVLAAFAVVLNYRGKTSDVKSFTGVEYRLEYITSINGVEVYNDSKSTNFNALSSALKSFMNKKVILIAGGQKQSDDYSIFSELPELTKCYLFGENKLQMHEFFSSHTKDCYCFDDLDMVFDNLDLTNCDVLLFSPGSISYDQFKSYIERGVVFNNLLEKFIKNLSKN